MAYHRKTYQVIEKRKLRGGKLEEVINKVRYGGEAYIVTERREQLIKILPVTGREAVVQKRRP
jgi:hypothetical protein